MHLDLTGILITRYLSRDFSASFGGPSVSCCRYFLLLVTWNQKPKIPIATNLRPAEERRDTLNDFHEPLGITVDFSHVFRVVVALALISKDLFVTSGFPTPGISVSCRLIVGPLSVALTTVVASLALERRDLFSLYFYQAKKCAWRRNEWPGRKSQIMKISPTTSLYFEFGRWIRTEKLLFTINQRHSNETYIMCFSCRLYVSYISNNTGSKLTFRYYFLGETFLTGTVTAFSDPLFFWF